MSKPMSRFKIVDERGTSKAQEYPLAVAARPFAVREFVNGQWLPMPGATYATKTEALLAARRFCFPAHA